MAALKYLIKGKKNPSTIYLRFKQGDSFDLTKSTSLVIDPKYWNNKKGSVRQISDFTNKLNLQNQLNSLKSHTLNSFNSYYSEGGAIDSDWLNFTIKDHFNQNESKDLNYVLDFTEQYISDLPRKVLRNGKVGVSENTLKRYISLLNKLKEFEKSYKKRLLFTDINLNFYNDLKNHLINVERLNLNTTGRYINYIKTICREANKNGIKVNPDIENGFFKPTKEEVKFITLNENEIDDIYNLELSNKPFLNNARNWLIVGVWTGARVSDLLNLTSKNINNGFIEYTSQKTNQKIILPIHPQIKDTLHRLDGQFPKKISSQKFNDYIKVVAKMAGIAHITLGSLNKEIQPGIWRKVKGEYKKFELVSSHVCRRSFATNLYGKLPTPVIMSITGHTTEKMFLNYIGKTAKDNAEILKEYWKV